MRDRCQVVLAATLLGCAGDGRDDQLTGPPTGATLSQGDGTAGESGEGGEGPGKLDVNGGVTQGSADDGVNQMGCEKVDFLFVIDGSGSMGDNQDSLIASFPGFITSIQQTLDEAQDYHIMVVDTDAEWGGMCETICPLFFDTCPEIPQYPCGQGPPSECDAMLGSGIVHTMATDAPNVPCNFSTGQRYMDISEPDLHGAFQCAAKVGSDGDSSERPMSAMVTALSPELIDAGGCNEGFVRQDAILVVTIITDEEDDDSTGFPDGWYQNILASKLGDPRAIVMLGLINDLDDPAPICPAESQDPIKVREFVDLWPNSIRGSVCAPSYNDFFQSAVDLIDTACDEFIPPEG